MNIKNPHGRRRRLLRTAAVTATALSVGLILAAPDVGASPRALFDSDPLANALAADVAEGLAPELEANDSFAGMAITPQGLEISAVGGGDKALQQIVTDANTAQQAVPLSVRSVARSRVELLQITASLDSRADTLREAGIAMSLWGPDYDSNTVLVTLEGASDGAETRLLDPYPPGTVRISPRYESNVASTRENDISPFYGGDHITRSTYNCTNWFSTYLSGVAYRVFTAAHCGSGTWRVAAGATIGSTTSSTWSGNVDAQAISAAGGAPTVWADPNASTRAVKSTSSTQPIGTLVCTDGYVDKEVCNVEVVNDDISVTYSGHTVTHTVRAHQKANLAAFSAGDSGGPVYSIVTGGVTARGMIYSHSTGDNSTGNYGKQQYITSTFGYPIRLL